MLEKAVKNKNLYVKSKELIINSAIKTLEIEANAIQNAKACIDEGFCTAVEHIFQSKGRVIVCGIGKSALIGQKIVATFNSTGTPAFFLHAADAIHGDLGMIQPQDIIMCISKSGDTPELKILLSFVKNLGNQVIALCSKADSHLAKLSDYAIIIPLKKEADPNNLAPTASSTAQLAVGDAMAVALLALRGFSQEDFAQFHPGGVLGKQLYLRVSDIYPHNEQPQVRNHADISTIIMEISSKRLGATAVVDEEGKVVGIITDGDLRRMMQKHPTYATLTAKEIMSPHPKSVAHDELAVEALSLMRKNSITQVIVLEADKYVGMIHLHDLIREGLI